MGTVVCFGEVMLRLSPPGYLRLGQGGLLEMTFGGAEANVAVSLANFGCRAKYVTILPDNPLVMEFLRQMRGFGVDVDSVLLAGERMGIYFVEKGAAMRPSKVVYDRKYSAIALTKPGDIDWARVFAGADWLHFTGITPALSESAAALTLEACQTAKAKGLTVSCDLNYRKNLWPRERARAVMSGLAEYIDILIANEEDPHDVFGISAEGSDIDGGTLSEAGYAGLAKRLAGMFRFRKVALTLRESASANDNNWSGLLYDSKSGAVNISTKYSIHIVDRVGGGDAFGAGLIHSLMTGASDREAVEFAAAASALKHTIEGDFNRVSAAEVRALIGGSKSGRVQR